MLRTVTASEDFGGELAKAVIANINPLLNTRDSANPLVAFVASIKNQPTRAEAKLHAQLVSILRSRERQAEVEVRAAAATLRGERSAIAAKAAEIRNLEEKVADLEKRAAAGLAGAEAELVAARIDLLKLRGELVQLVADWHVAEVKLRQAMGMLVRE
jgi:outer membrane protein TolC